MTNVLGNGNAGEDDGMDLGGGNEWRATCAATPAQAIAVLAKAGYTHTATEGQTAWLELGGTTVRIESIVGGAAVTSASALTPAATRALASLDHFVEVDASFTPTAPQVAPGGTPPSSRLRSTMGARSSVGPQPDVPSRPGEEVALNPFAPIPPTAGVVVASGIPAAAETPRPYLDAALAEAAASSRASTATAAPSPIVDPTKPPPPLALSGPLPGAGVISASRGQAGDLTRLPPPPVAPGTTASPIVDDPRPPPPVMAGTTKPVAKAPASTAPPTASTGKSTLGCIGSVLSSVRKLVYAVIIVGGICTIAYFWINGYRRPASLVSGNCIKEIPMYSNVDTQTVDCSSAQARYRVTSNVEARDVAYPSNINSLGDSCENTGGTAVLPDRRSFDAGDHMVLCLKRVSKR